MKYFEISDDSHSIRILGSMPASTNARIYDAENCDPNCPSSSISGEIISEGDIQRGVEHTIEFFSPDDEDAVPCTVDCDSCSITKRIEPTGSSQDANLDTTLCVSVIVDATQEVSGSDEAPGKGIYQVKETPIGGEDPGRYKAKGSDDAPGKDEHQKGDKALGRDEAPGRYQPQGRDKALGRDEAQGRGTTHGGSNIGYCAMTTEESCLQEPKQKGHLNFDSDSDDDIYDTPDANQQRRKLPEERPFQAMNSEFFVDTTLALTKTYVNVVYPKQPAVNPPRELVCNAAISNRGFGAKLATNIASSWRSATIQGGQNPQIYSGAPTHKVLYASNELTLSVDGKPQAKVTAVDEYGCLNLAQAIEEIIPAELLRFSALMATLIQTLVQRGVGRFSVAFTPPQSGPGQPLLDTDPTPTVFGLPPTGLDTMHQGIPDLGMDTWATDLPSMCLDTGATGFPNQGWQ